MKRVLLLIVVVLVGLIYVFRQRVFLRDPLATVSRNEVEQHRVQVFMNGRGAVLLEKDGEDGFRILVQEGAVPGTPTHLTCIRWMACLTEANVAPVVPVVWTGKGKYEPQVTIARGEVSFVDGDGSRMRVELR